ncbi:hypothetical protein [Streptomyces griseofuscus]|uniref:hypothetical protein n=1 Tax=Streptomyces griseofuscus TaxID=146922 RepID=UPI0033C2DDCF
MSVPFSEMGDRSVTACLPSGTKAQLDALKPFFEAERERARQLSMADTTGLNALEAAARMVLWREQKEALRRQGQLTDSKKALVIGGLVQVLTERGWNRVWPRVPGPRQGRWPGAPQSGPWPEEDTIDLPADLVTTVGAACWHTSAEPIRLLRQWRERYPRAIPSRPTRSACTIEALEEYQRLSAAIITKGDVWRAAYAAGIRIAVERQRGMGMCRDRGHRTSAPYTVIKPA